MVFVGRAAEEAVQQVVVNKKCAVIVKKLRAA